MAIRQTKETRHLLRRRLLLALCFHDALDFIFSYAPNSHTSPSARLRLPPKTPKDIIYCALRETLRRVARYTSQLSAVHINMLNHSPSTMSSLPATRLDIRREFLSRLGATVNVDNSIVVDDPASETSSSNSDGTSRSTARDRLDLLLGLSHRSSPSSSASSLSCNHHISTFPSMCIFSTSPPRSASPTRHQEVQDSASAEQVASASLSRPVGYKREEVASAPERLARSVTSTYSLLIQSNISAVTRKLNIRREALPPIRIATVSTSFVQDISKYDSDNDAKRTTHEGVTDTSKIRIDLDFLLSIDNALATFSATACGSLICELQ